MRGAALVALFYMPFVHCDGDAEENEEDSLASTNIILFLFFGLGVGILAMQCLSILGEKLPYTVVIFILGAILSTADHTNGKPIAHSETILPD